MIDDREDTIYLILKKALEIPARDPTRFFLLKPGLFFIKFKRFGGHFLVNFFLSHFRLGHFRFLFVFVLDLLNPCYGRSYLFVFSFGLSIANLLRFFSPLGAKD
jgi:hypothetical protein